MMNKQIMKRLNTYFQKRVGMFVYKRGWLKGDCPSCGKEKKFGVNLGQNRTNCFVCGYKKKPFEVMMDIEGFGNKSEGTSYLLNFEELEVIEYIADINKNEHKIAYLPPHFKSIMVGESQYAKSARSYLKGRGFDIEKLALSGWGYCTEGKWKGYIIMPFYHRGNLIYFNARLYLGSGTKHNNPPADEFGVGKNQIIYNIDALYKYKRIYLVESVMNAETLGDRAISIGGKTISQSQLTTIIRSQVEEVVIILDDDAIKYAIKLAMELCFYKKVKLIEVPENKDVNDLGKVETLKRVFREDFTNYNKLLKRLHEVTKHTY